MKMKLQKPTFQQGRGKLVILLLLAFGVAAAAEAAMAIRIDSVTQRWPWNNKVDIAYTVEGGQELATSNFCKIVFSTVIGGNTYTIDGTTVGASANEGPHKVTWTLPSGVKGADCTMTAAVYPSAVPGGNDYMIIDLDTGAISYEGLFATQEESNRRYNTALYKKDKLVLRKVPAGGPYPTGDSLHYTSATAPNSYMYNTDKKDWTTDRDYYIGVFPVTQAQYQKIVGANPSGKKTVISGNIVEQRPMECISWFRLRCDLTAEQVYYAPTSPVPAVAEANTGTFFQRLNYKTGKYFDLPTEVMWEIAARAGSTACYFWGSTTNSILDYVISSESPETNDGTGAGTSTVAVGSRLPNEWGLYDLSGNVYQLCLDDVRSGNLKERTGVFAPACVASPTATNWDVRRIRTGGCYNNSCLTQGYYTSYRGQVKFNMGTSTVGFRIAHIVQ